MNRELNLTEILVLLGGAGVFLGLTFFGPGALGVGIGSFVFAAGAVAYQWYQAGEVRGSKRVDFTSADVARSRIGDAASQLALRGIGWARCDDGWTQTFEPVMAGDEGFWIDCYVVASGRADLLLGSHGIQQETLFGTLRIGPEAPFGVDEFLRLLKAIGGARSLPVFANLITSISTPMSHPIDRDGRDSPQPPPVPAQRTARFCHSCGHAFDSEERFCAACGTERRERASAGLPHPSTPAAESTTKPPEVVQASAIEDLASDDDAAVQPTEEAGCCSLCGSTLLRAAVFCIHCGGAVDGATAWR